MKIPKPAFFFFFIILFGCNSDQQWINKKPVFDPNPSPAYLSPEETMERIYLPDGYHLELVASEPMIKEPVTICWDGKGRMYVAEMLTYMRDADASDERLPISQIKLLEDTDNDGKMDKSTVFIDSLLLPRMIQTVGDELLVNVTNSLDIISYKDTDGDGKADTKKVIFQKKDFTTNANMEHQRSGLDWNLDNWMYMTYEPFRLRYTKDTIEIDTIFSGGRGQWGLAHDNYGRLYFSSAGGEVPAHDFQINPIYGKLDLAGQLDPEFQQVWPIMATPDVQGGLPRLRENNTLNHFTGACGQSIFRGDALADDLVGDYLVCEPVGRIIRRAKVINDRGKIILKNAYDSSEFIASQDMNFRPVYSATGPDGCLYIVDMYRGIIQQGSWTEPGSFLRNKIDSLGLAKNINRGRIYRVVYKDKKKNEKLNMIDEPSASLVQYLNHPNGWRRDNAQKTIVFRNDKSVVPELIKMVKNTQSGDAGHLGRIHALWTLDGLNSVDKELIESAFKDPHPQVRRTAIWISEKWLMNNDEDMMQKVMSLREDENYDVRLQVLLSLSRSPSPVAKAMVDSLVKDESDNEILVAAKNGIDKSKIHHRLVEELGSLEKKDWRMVLNGLSTFMSLCASCHGSYGEGMGSGNSLTSPPLKGARFLSLPEKNNAIRILLNGLSGNLEGKTYSSEMPSMAENNDEWIASVLSYLRYDMNKNVPANKPASFMVYPEEVRKMRAAESGRTKPWTEKELLLRK